jgi:phenylacetate-CoA ligase
MFWNKEIECASRDHLRDVQNSKLRDMLVRASRTEFYRESETRGIDPGTLTLDELPHLFFTHKSDLRRYYPFGMLACDMKEVVEVHASSGTTGKPTTVGYTRNDIKVWKQAMARAMTAAGVTQNDIVQNAYGYGLFTGGLGFHYGCDEIGATVIPVSGGRTDFQLMIAEDFESTALCCTPSFALYLAGEAEQMNRSLKNTRLRVGMFGAEPWSEDMRELIESKSGLKAFDCYGLSEIIGPGVAFECSEQNGLHVNEDFFFPEVIDRESGEPVAEGEMGELVITSLAREAVPLVRYRTGDRVFLTAEPCACGRTLRRMSRVVGRTDDMLIVAGVNFYPSQVESLILGVEGTNGQYQIWLWTEDARDYIEARIEVDADLYSDPESCASLADQVAARLRDNIGIRILVKVVKHGAIERPTGKAIRVVDKREKR